MKEKGYISNNLEKSETRQAPYGDAAIFGNVVNAIKKGRALRGSRKESL